MRSKEDANDYRYFPDPDLLPVVIDDTLIEKMRAELPELPEAKVARYVSELHLSKYDAEVLVADAETTIYFEQASVGTNAKSVANWITSELFGKLNKNSMSLHECKITPLMLRDLVSMIEAGTISGKIAKSVFEEMFSSGEAPEKIVEDKGMLQVSDSDSILKIIDEVILANPDSLEAYRAGKDRLLGFFVGQVMKISGGKANPSMVNDLLKEKLK